MKSKDVGDEGEKLIVDYFVKQGNSIVKTTLKQDKEEHIDFVITTSLGNLIPIQVKNEIWISKRLDRGEEPNFFFQVSKIENCKAKFYLVIDAKRNRFFKMKVEDIKNIWTIIKEQGTLIHVKQTNGREHPGYYFPITKTKELIKIEEVTL